MVKKNSKCIYKELWDEQNDNKVENHSSKINSKI